jgi:endonuclease YncB( thermonuclease family)
MRRRHFLQSAVAAVGSIVLGSDAASAADTQLEPGTWYDATVLDVTDGDTIDVKLDSDGTEYEIRTLGLDTPETKRNSRYEEVREWEGIEDDNYLADWGENAKDHAQAEFPDGKSVQIAVDENEDEEDTYGRLLAYIRYDKSGDGSMDTLYNRDVVEQGYARVYGSSLTKHDDIWQAERNARDAGRRVWQQSDPANTSEVDNDPVSEVWAPDASSVRTDSGAIDPSRVPVFAESTAYQSLGSNGIDYADIPLVGVDEANNAALVGGLPIDESLEDDAQGQHQVFLTNLVDYLSSKTGRVLISGGNREFNASNALSNEDTVVYQRFLEGVGIDFEQVNRLDSSYGNSLDSARAIVMTNPPQAYSSGELDALSTFVSNGGAVVMMASADATDTMRSNLDDIAAGIGSDLRVNDDKVFDDDSNAGSSNLVVTSNFDTSYPLFDAYSDDSGSGNSSPSCTIVNPSDGDTVSGTVTVQVDAADSEDSDDSLTVEVAIDGGSYQTAAYNSTSGYYEYDWDTTGVADGDHTVDARATDSDGATTDASQITVTVDNTASAPTVDALSASEVETSDGDAEFDVSWDVGDSDGDLSSVDLTLTDDTAGETEDSASISVSGSDATGTTRLVAAGDDGSGNSYTVDCTVTDSNGNTASDSTSVSETEDTASAPTIDTFSLTDESNPQWDKYSVDWAVSDDDGDLADVTTEMLDSSGTVLDSDSDAISGSSASGSHFVRSKSTAAEVVLTVTDAAGNSTSQSKSV